MPGHATVFWESAKRGTTETSTETSQAVNDEKRERTKRRFYPETGAGGFSSVDGTVEFYTRVNALLRPDMAVLDFGAGRGAWTEDAQAPYRRGLRMLKGKVRKVVGIDIDDAIHANPALDEALVREADRPLPFADAEFNLILTDFVFEHVTTPEIVARELDRVLKPGGWLCARTPNRFGYIALGATLAPALLHHRLLRRAQPGRQSRDVFPAVYRMNSPARLRRLFPPARYDDYSYAHNAEPAYFGGSVAAWRAMRLLFRLLPPALGAALFIFKQKRSA